MQYRAVQYVDAVPNDVQDALAEEQALAVSINGQPYTLTMRTPGDDRALVAGLLFTEHIIHRRADLLHCELRPCQTASYRSYADVHLPPELAQRAQLSGRSMLANSSCGMCGKTDIGGMHFPAEPIEHQLSLDIAWLERMQQMVAERQQLFRSTGGCHAAAAFAIDGQLLCLMEDIGRHNAVDKVIGQLLLDGQLDRAAIISVSGRVSYEIVAKLHAARIPFLVSVSAPSSLAVDVCRQLGMTLISFCRGNRATVYSHNQAVTGVTEIEVAR